MRQQAPEVAAHNLAVGQFAYDMLLASGCSVEVSEFAAVSGAVHDLGKLRPDLLDASRSGDVWTPEYRTWFAAEHAQGGAQRISELPGFDSSEALGYAATVARYHHEPILPGYASGNVAQAPAQLRAARGDTLLTLGIIDVVQVCDVLHAVGFDRMRKYVEGREGRPITPEVVLGIVEGNRYGNPMVEGQTINVHELVSERLGLLS
jgi:hypothetical protein